MNGIKAKDVVNYAVMPGIIPRFRALFARGFGHIAFMLAHIYGMARILPAAHPYLNETNIHKFGIRHVIVAGANHLVLSRKHIDQIVVFALTVLGIMLLFGQLILLVLSLLTQAAHAQITAPGALGFASMFDTANPENDIAYQILGRVFGLPDFFCSFTTGVCVDVNADLPFPIHEALQNMFGFYSVGLLMVAILIFLYFVVVVVAETAASGTPFGQRFQNIWVPIRLVVAIGLLVPLPMSGTASAVNGFNTGQYIAFYAAKMGSSFATNGWILFNNSIAAATASPSNPTGEHESLVAVPEALSAAPIIEMMSIVHTCAQAYHIRYGAANTTPPPDSANFYHVRPFLVRTTPFADRDDRIEEWTGSGVMPDIDYYEALEFFNFGDILIRFGEDGRYNPAQGNIPRPDASRLYATEQFIRSWCGEVRVPVNVLRHADEPDNVGGPPYMLRFYYNMIWELWQDPEMADYGRYIALLEVTHGSRANPDEMCEIAERYPNIFPPNQTQTGMNTQQCRVEIPSHDWKQDMINRLQARIEEETFEAWRLYASYEVNHDLEDSVLARGWGGAGIWYNRIADLNGAFITSITNAPIMDSYPYWMERVREARRQQDTNTAPEDQFCLTSDDGEINLEGGDEARNIIRALCRVYRFWRVDARDQSDTDRIYTNNILVDIINFIMGTEALFDIRGDNAHVHPLAQLVAVGKGLVDAAVINLMGATSLSALGSLLSSAGFQGAGGLSSAAGGFLNSVTFLALTAGFVLYYVVPFLPFVFFFFAVSSWVRTIFEAMVGIPLWALAHMRLDGDGLPGQAAANGYYLILEIFLRPILTVFGLIAAILIFSSQVRLLNFLWDVVTQNVAGHQDNPEIDMLVYNLDRAPIDHLFFTIIYTIIVYLMAMASFKLIDKVPDGILRWMGSGASAFGDDDQDPSEQLSSIAARGGMIQGQQLTDGVTQGASGVGGAIGSLMRSE